MSSETQQSSRLLAAGFLVALVAVLVGGGVALYRNGAFSKNSAITPATTAVSYSVAGTTGTLTLPHAGATVQLPTGTWPLTASDIAQFNDQEQSWHDCGTLLKESPGGSGIWISYGKFGACVTENSFPMVENTLFATEINATCDRLQNSKFYIGADVEFAGCQTMTDPPPGFAGVTFYEFVPDYIDMIRGTIIRVHYLASTTHQNIRFIFVFTPQTSAGTTASTTRSVFGYAVSKIMSGTDAQFSPSNTDYNTFEYAVRSLRQPAGN